MLYCNRKDLFYYILCSFNKLKLDKNDINKLIKLGYCETCISIIENQELSKQEINYINNKNWDNFIDKYPLSLNQCHCIKCICGKNKIFNIMYDFCDINEINPICTLICNECIKLKIPTNKKNISKRSYSDIENNNNLNSKLCSVDKNKLMTKVIEINNNKLICN